MKRTVSGVLVCGVAVLALVGCGKGETTREGAVSSTQTAPPFDGGGAVVEREAAPGDQTQAGLEATLAEQYTHVQALGALSFSAGGSVGTMRTSSDLRHAYDTNSRSSNRT